MLSVGTHVDVPQSRTDALSVNRLKSQPAQGLLEALPQWVSNEQLPLRSVLILDQAGPIAPGKQQAAVRRRYASRIATHPE
jgi:hypothetical protein